MNSVTVIFTCYNRLEKTKKCIETIQDDKADIRFIITDDKSSDGTGKYLEGLKSEYPDKYTILHGNGNLFWSGGMRNGIGFYLDKGEKTDYVALINDDVVFEPGILSYMVCRSKTKNNAVIAGATANKNGGISYGGVEYIKGTVKCGIIPLEDADTKKCDTFNCNCTLIPDEIIRKAGNFDYHYTHALSDFDYGFTINRLGYDVYETERIIGYCDDNDVRGGWRDTSLSRITRLKKKESPKGLPWKEWFYYLKKNFGIRKAVWHSITPYLRILLGI